MLEVNIAPTDTVIRLSPNCSASWHSNRRIIAAIGGFNLLLACAAMSRGAWPILPLLGLEVAIAYIILNTVYQKLQYQQVLHLSAEAVNIDAGRQRAEQHWQWARQRCKVLVDPQDHPWDPLKIALCHRGERVKLGHFLNRADSRDLLKTLRQQGLPVLMSTAQQRFSA